MDSIANRPSKKVMIDTTGNFYCRYCGTKTTTDGVLFESAPQLVGHMGRCSARPISRKGIIERQRALADLPPSDVLTATLDRLGRLQTRVSSLLAEMNELKDTLLEFESTYTAVTAKK